MVRLYVSDCVDVGVAVQLRDAADDVLVGWKAGGPWSGVGIDDYLPLSSWFPGQHFFSRETNELQKNVRGEGRAEDMSQDSKSGPKRGRIDRYHSLHGWVGFDGGGDVVPVSAIVAWVEVEGEDDVEGI